MKLRVLAHTTVGVAGLSLWLVASAQAQGVGAIGGTTTDQSGAVLPGVTVTLSNPGTIGGNQVAVTDARGAYQFLRLVPGRYSVKAELVGFQSLVQENVVVDADATSRADLRLQVGDLEETVTVSGEAPLLDTTAVLNQTVMSREVLDTLPGTNDLWAIAKLVPAVTLNQYDVGGTNGFQQSTVSVHGSRTASETAYLIDGMNIGSVGADGGSVTMYYDPFMFEQINYQAGGVSAETSRGGIVYNMVTQTGTNAFRGAFMFNGSNEHLQSNNISPELRTDLLAAVPPLALAANPNLEPGSKIISMYDTGATLSGPIARDKLWFVERESSCASISSGSEATIPTARSLSTTTEWSRFQPKHHGRRVRPVSSTIPTRITTSSATTGAVTAPRISGRAPRRDARSLKQISIK